MDVREWGPPLRFTAPVGLLERFGASVVPRLPECVVYGSGDFHHLSALLLRRVAERVVLLSFDNHPDWDIRPPRWSCGGWINRALELPNVQRAEVWGCGNFECWWPARIFGNQRAERAGRLSVHPWADGRRPNERERRGAILRADWREHFGRFAQSLAGQAVYVTVDLDCLTEADAVTNWENGRFLRDDLLWAIGELQKSCDIIASDICGAYSVPRYARKTQEFVANWDHPRRPPPCADEAAATNSRTLRELLPILTV